ncbi:MAG: hypothetical protein ACOVN0_08205 [Niveispirillum sp.]|uniref:hypothetical protein n=1 Tax=Niveispirillum sp. TaxID=1917217 RepID=UPI003BA6CD63
MTKQAWFVPKSHGIGYTPSRWQGWLATVAFVLILVGGVKALQAYAPIPPGPWRPIIMLIWTALAVGIFLFVMRSRTEGEMRWRWGSRT